MGGCGRGGYEGVREEVREWDRVVRRSWVVVCVGGYVVVGRSSVYFCWEDQRGLRGAGGFRCIKSSRTRDE